MEEHREAEGAGELDLGAVDPQEIVRAAEETAREHPHASIAGAFALGFLLGGGLTPRLLASLVITLGRRYAAEAAREAIGAAVLRGTGASDGERP